MNGYTREALDLAMNMNQVQERQRLRLAAAEVFDRRLARKRTELNRFGKSGRLNRQISVVAVMNAVNTEGRDVLKPEAAGYWKDQDRRYFGITEGTSNVTAMKNRLGKVTYRKVYYADGRRTTDDRRQTGVETLIADGGRRTTDQTGTEQHTSMENKNITIMVI